MDAKPIFVIRLNYNHYNNLNINDVFENFKSKMPTLFEEYHVIFSTCEDTHTKFECYNIDFIPENTRIRTMGLINDIISKHIN